MRRLKITNGTIGDFIGCLSQQGGPRLTIDQINEIATCGWVK